MEQQPFFYQTFCTNGTAVIAKQWVLNYKGDVAVRGWRTGGGSSEGGREGNTVEWANRRKIYMSKKFKEWDKIKVGTGRGGARQKNKKMESEGDKD